MPEGPLRDVLVLDLAQALAGPIAAMMLGDLGAHVIKVEKPQSGDDSPSGGPRSWVPVMLRNRAALLDAAQRHFLDHGVETSLEAVAREAGVGPGTLYRHFRSREALLAAVLHTRQQELESHRADIADVKEPMDALRSWMRAMEEYFSAFSGLPEPLMAAANAEEPGNPLTVLCHEIIATTDEYLEAAQRAGKVRSSVKGVDLFLAAVFVAWAMGVGTIDDESLDRLRGLFEHGYRETNDNP